jgi:predicted CoA-binding protein
MARAISPTTEFLAHRRLAVVGVSRDPRSFSRHVFAELRRRGYDAVPVNAVAQGEVEGVPFVRRVQDVQPAVEAALLITPPAVTAEVVKDCAEAGVRQVWMHRGVGVGSASPEGLDLCRRLGITVVDDACPFMYLPESGLVHRAHRWCRQVFGGNRPSVTAGPVA